MLVRERVLEAELGPELEQALEEQLEERDLVLVADEQRRKWVTELPA